MRTRYVSQTDRLTGGGWGRPRQMEGSCSDDGTGTVVELDSVMFQRASSVPVEVRRGGAAAISGHFLNRNRVQSCLEFWTKRMRCVVVIIMICFSDADDDGAAPPAQIAPQSGGKPGGEGEFF
jgi:hypothetical protein